MDDLFIAGRKKRIFDWQAGLRIGNLVYTGQTYTKQFNGQWKRLVECICDCGAVRDFWYSAISCGDTKSCGCFRKKVTKKRSTTHGLSNHLLYDVHKHMIARCYDVKDSSYKNYGARGIEVWKDWKDDFICFYDWCITNGYKEGLSIDRINNDGNYAPFNCRFADAKTQGRNTRSTKNFTAFGETKCITDWGKDERCVVSVWTLFHRVRHPKWEGRFEDVLTNKGDKITESRTKKTNIYIEAFGERKCMSEWVEDERCLVKIDAIRDRYRKGWDGERILTTPPHSSGKKGITNYIIDETVNTIARK